MQMIDRLGPGASGILPSQWIAEAIKSAWITSEASDIPDENIQPASLDLRLGNVAYRLRCSFLPDTESVEAKLERYHMGTVDLTGEGGILEQNRPYLIPLVEQLDLPTSVRAKANPKSSTGRLDVFTRVITDHNFTFDEIPAGYKGPMYLEVVPRAFAIRVRSQLTLNQLRLIIGNCSLSDRDIVELHHRMPLLYRHDNPVPAPQISVNNGLFLSLNLGHKRGRQLVGYRAKESSDLIDMSKTNYYYPFSFWERVFSERGARIVLLPEKFYLLLSQDRVRIPPEYAAEMTAYDPTSGELRTHYAGFFDPGFGESTIAGLVCGSRAALEVRAHDVPFAVEHGQNICKLSFERMLEPPDRRYGLDLSSNYQNQEIALGKHFRRKDRRQPNQPDLFAPNSEWTPVQ